MVHTICYYSLTQIGEHMKNYDNKQFINKLVHEYKKDKLKEKYDLIVKTLKKEKIYISESDYLISMEIRNKHCFPIYLNLNRNSSKKEKYMETCIDYMIDFIKNYNIYSDYKIKYFVLDPDSNSENNLIIKISDFNKK